MKTHAYQRHEKHKSESNAKKSTQRAARSQPAYPEDDAPPMAGDGNGSQDNDAAAEAENQGDDEDGDDGEDTSQEG